MKRIFLLALISIALSACAVDGKPNKSPIKSSNCNAEKGYTATQFKYHDGNEKGNDKQLLRMKRYSVITADSEFRIKLITSGDAENSLVTVTGKSGKDKNNNPLSFSWLNTSGHEKDSPLIICAPTSVPEGAEYKFDVHVEGIGTLDPRAHVEN